MDKVSCNMDIFYGYGLPDLPGLDWKRKNNQIIY